MLWSPLSVFLPLGLQVVETEQGLLRRMASHPQGSGRPSVAKASPELSSEPTSEREQGEGWTEGVREGGKREGGWPHLRLVALEHIPAEEAILALPPHCVVPASALRAAAQRGGERGEEGEGVGGGDEEDDGKGRRRQSGEEGGPGDVNLSPWQGREPLPYADAPDDVILTAWLLRERAKGERSLWLPLLDLLPDRSPVPLFWSEQQVQELELRYAMQKVRGSTALYCTAPCCSVLHCPVLYCTVLCSRTGDRPPVLERAAGAGAGAAPCHAKGARGCDAVVY